MREPINHLINSKMLNSGMTRFELFTQSNHSKAHSVIYLVTPLMCNQIQKQPVDSAVVLFTMISLVRQKIDKVSHDIQTNIKNVTSLLYNSSINNVVNIE